MPIRGLTDRGMAFPQIGQIRKGGKVTKTTKQGKQVEMPVDLEYFRVVFDEREEATSAKFLASYGEKPTDINIYFPFDQIERMWDAWLEAYTANRMVARSDGAMITYQVNPSTGEVIVQNGYNIKTGEVALYTPGMPAGTDYQGKPIPFSPVGRLRVIVPELQRAAYMLLITGSFRDIDNISQQLLAFKTLNKGIISGIPFTLRRRPQWIQVPLNDGTKQRVKKWMVSIEAAPDWVQAQIEASRVRAFPEHLLMPGSAENEIIDGSMADIESEQEMPADPFKSPASASYQIATPEPEVDESEDNTEAGLPEGAQEATETTLPGNGAPATAATRPFAPDVVRAKLRNARDTWILQPFEPKDRAESDIEICLGVVAHNLEACFAGHADSKERRYTIAKFVFGTASLKDLDIEALVALKRWLNAKPDSGGEWVVDPLAVKEAISMYDAALIAEGQQQFDLQGASADASEELP